jgi:hypothetical protein
MSSRYIYVYKPSCAHFLSAYIYICPSTIHLQVNKKWKFQDRILLITESALYNLTTKFVIKRRVALADVKGLSLSTFADNFIVFHIPNEYDYVFTCSKKSEIVTVLTEVASSFSIALNFSDSIDVTIKKKNVLKIVFAEDKSLGKGQVLKKGCTR